MKSICIFNPKGGVGKTTSAVSIAYFLSAEFEKKRVLLVDCDQQGSASVALGVYNRDENSPSISTLLTDKGADVRACIVPTEYPNLSVIPANSALDKANKLVLLDSATPQQTRLRKHLAKVADEYDYIIFDCPPDTTMATYNALAFTHTVVAPCRADKYSFRALGQVLEIIEDNMQDFNPSLTFGGALFTMWTRAGVNAECLDAAYQNGIPCYDTHIRSTTKANESTFKTPLPLSAPLSTATQDYYSLIEEMFNLKQL